jgi:hypothetical protein
VVNLIGASNLGQKGSEKDRFGWKSIVKRLLPGVGWVSDSILALVRGAIKQTLVTVKRRKYDKPRILPLQKQERDYGQK